MHRVCTRARPRGGAWWTAAAVFLAALALVGCLGGRAPGSLAPTLEMVDVDGTSIGYQNGIPVPGFDWQPRPRLDLDGAWRMARAELDAELTMTDRATALPAIEAEAAGRQLREHDVREWGSQEVPGTFNAPPDGTEGGAWYRRTIEVPEVWAGRAVSLRFASVNYVADVWLNDVWLGYHEGGSTPFAFDVGAVLEPGADNVVAVRVHAIPIGTRADVVPWALVDWWNYAGITGDVWLEAAPAAHVARADVHPFLDAVDVGVVLDHAASLAGRRGTASVDDREAATAILSASILPATVTEENLLDPDPRALLAPSADALVTVEQEVAVPNPGGATATTLSFTFGEADLWSPARPALYVLRVDLRWAERPMDAREARPTDTYWTIFGIRHVAVDPIEPRVLLNGEAAFFRGVGIHDEALTFDTNGTLVGGTPAPGGEETLAALREAGAVGADLVRAGHQPADPTLLMLADRLGFAVWEEIPLYHATPAIFERTMGRGIPQQMLREMALRDMNHPSVLFHGLANESTGTEERAAALAELHRVDREVDGTRLTGQAAYGWQPTDPTQAPLDVAGYTFYHGVFYGEEPGPDTRRALREAHEAHPDKPILALEFGRWADTAPDEALQRAIFENTYAALAYHRADEPGGYVAAASWWTLRDFATQLPGIGVEDFGLYRRDGTLRPAGELAVEAWGATAGEGAELAIEPDLERPRAVPSSAMSDWSLAIYLLYALAVAGGLIGLALAILMRRGGRAIGRSR